MITGEAKDDRELFEFTIEPFVTTGYLLSIRYSGDCHHNITGAGVWPSVEKAKQIAQATATKLLHGSGRLLEGIIKLALPQKPRARWQ
jgi:hypothetical protein